MWSGCNYLEKIKFNDIHLHTEPEVKPQLQSEQRSI